MKKYIVSLFKIGILLSFGFFMANCKKEEVKTPVITTVDVSQITENSVVSGGSITSDGGASVFARGLVLALSGEPSLENNDGFTSEGKGSGVFSSKLEGLESGTDYVLRSFATNIAGTSYGNLISFTTLKSISKPVLTTSEINNITVNSGRSGGIVSDNGGSEIIAQGVCWNTYINPLISDFRTSDSIGIDSYVSELHSLTPNTVYYVRAYATNLAGTSYGNQLSFKTLQPNSVPVLETSEITDVTANSAICGGLFTDMGGLAITEQGICWSNSTKPETSDFKVSAILENTSFSGKIEGLIPNTVYFIRAYAANELGTGYGNELSFRTLLEGDTGTVSDNEGNIYKTITIGEQTWMAENLRATKYQNGDTIGTTYPSDLSIYSISTPKYQWVFNGDENNVKDYGRLYTWNAALDKRNICPVGWHVPSNQEWNVLSDFLGGEYIAGTKLKESGFSHWNYPNYGTNEVGFAALPGGYRQADGKYYYMNSCGFWWSTTRDNIGYPSYRTMYYDNGNLNLFQLTITEKCGLSIRCIKN